MTPKPTPVPTDPDVEWLHGQMCFHIRLPFGGSAGECPTKLRIRRLLKQRFEDGFKFADSVARKRVAL